MKSTKPRLFLLGAGALALGIFLWKGASLAALDRQIAARGAMVAEFYKESIGRNAPPLQAASTALAPEKRAAVNAFAASLTALETPGTEPIIGAQKGFMTLMENVNGAPELAGRPELAALAEDLQRGGGVQPALDAYNVRVQAWNNAIEDPLGRFYARLFGLDRRLLLRADGEAEYETEVTL